MKAENTYYKCCAVIANSSPIPTQSKKESIRIVVSSVADEAIGILYEHTVRCGFLCLNFLLARKQIKAFEKKAHIK